MRDTEGRSGRHQRPDRDRRHRPDRVRQRARRQRAVARVSGDLDGDRRCRPRPVGRRRAGHVLMENGREVEVARNVGLGDITYFGEIGYGGGAGCGTVGHAAMAVATGQCAASRSRGGRASARPQGQPAVGAREPAPQRCNAVEPAVRDAATGRRDRHAGAPLHARVRRDPRAPRRTSRWRSASTPTATPTRRCTRSS